MQKCKNENNIQNKSVGLELGLGLEMCIAIVFTFTFSHFILSLQVHCRFWWQQLIAVNYCLNVCVLVAIGSPMPDISVPIMPITDFVFRDMKNFGSRPALVSYYW